MIIQVFDGSENTKETWVPDYWWEKPYDYRMGWLDSIYGKDWAHASTHIAASGHTKSMVATRLKTGATCHD